jgi:predicted dehydrogenase
VEELASAQVRFANGASLILEVSWLLHHKVPPGQYEDMQLWLYGTRGGAHWPSDEILRSDAGQQQTIDACLECTADPLPPHARECVAFAEAIGTGAPSPVPAEQSLDLMSVLQGLYRSAAENREVRLDGE